MGWGAGDGKGAPSGLHKPLEGLWLSIWEIRSRGGVLGRVVAYPTQRVNGLDSLGCCIKCRLQGGEGRGREPSESATAVF